MLLKLLGEMLLKLFEGGLFISYYPESLVDLFCPNKMRNHKLQMGLFLFYVITNHTLQVLFALIYFNKMMRH